MSYAGRLTEVQLRQYERIVRAFDKADRLTKLEFLSFIDEWQQARRDELDRQRLENHPRNDRDF